MNLFENLQFLEDSSFGDEMRANAQSNESKTAAFDIAVKMWAQVPERFKSPSGDMAAHDALQQWLMDRFPLSSFAESTKLTENQEYIGDVYPDMEDYILDKMIDSFNQAKIRGDFEFDDTYFTSTSFCMDVIYYPPNAKGPEDGIKEGCNIKCFYSDAYDDDDVDMDNIDFGGRNLPSEQEMKEIINSSIEEEVPNLIEYFKSKVQK